MAWVIWVSCRGGGDYSPKWLAYHLAMISIHRIVLRRLLLAWLAVSLLAGGAAYFIELKKTDAAIIALAAGQSARFSPEVLDSARDNAEALRTLQDKAGEFVKRNFVVIDLYDRQEKHILQVINPAYRDLESALAQFPKQFAHDVHGHYEQFALGADTLVRVGAPLPDRGGDSAGFFEGIFIVDQATLTEFRNRLWRTLIAVLGAVLATTLLLYPVILALNRDVMRFSREVFKGNVEIVSVLGTAIAKRDTDTGEHNFRVTLYAARFGHSLGLSAGAIRRLMLGAFLHDVGKIGLPDNILLKPGALTAEEFAIMRSHVRLGVDIIAQSTWLRGAQPVIEGHHEKFDGSGYLRGLKGEAIPLNARIFTIVDVFDALTSRRPYKAAMSLDAALEIMRQKTGSHFDPVLLEHFLSIAPALYAAVGQADEATLLAEMREQGMHYFLRASLAARPDDPSA